jgi:large subunit ribosomal protein L6
MSRIGKIPVKLPEKVKANFDAPNRVLKVEGPKGKLEVKIARGVNVEVKGGEVVVTRPDDTAASKSLHGLTRTLVANATLGVTNGWERALEINGVGFKAETKGKKVVFTLGYSHVINFEPPAGITLDIQKEGKSITVKGADKELVGSTASKVRSFRVPDPYKAYGIKYVEEVIRRKEGKTGAA